MSPFKGVFFPVFFFFKVILIMVCFSRLLYKETKATEPQHKLKLKTVQVPQNEPREDYISQYYLLSLWGKCRSSLAW